MTKFFSELLEVKKQYALSGGDESDLKIVVGSRPALAAVINKMCLHPTNMIDIAGDPVQLLGCSVEVSKALPTYSLLMVTGDQVVAVFNLEHTIVKPFKRLL